jgi:tetratricopeptide (TPR) repeat protein
MEDLMTLAEYALQRTPNAEEALLWRGWGHYRLGDTTQAMDDFRQALQENPYYQDAQYALSYINQNR